MDKKKITCLFDSMTKQIEGMTPLETYEVVGTAVGLVALVIERSDGPDRAVTFKMLQRHGHAAIKELERAQRRKADV
jgi:hypothetical protein